MNRVMAILSAAAMVAASPAATKLPDWGLEKNQCEETVQKIEHKANKHQYPIGSTTPKKIKKSYGKPKLTRKQRKRR